MLNMSDYGGMNSDDMFTTDELREMGRDIEYRLDAQDEARWAADQNTAAWDGRGITNTPDGPVTTEEW